MSFSYTLKYTLNAVSSLLPTVSPTELTSAGAANEVSRNGKSGKYSHYLPPDIAADVSIQLQKHEGYKYLLLLSSTVAQINVLTADIPQTK